MYNQFVVMDGSLYENKGNTTCFGSVCYLDGLRRPHCLALLSRFSVKDRKGRSGEKPGAPFSKQQGALRGC